MYPISPVPLLTPPTVPLNLSLSRFGGDDLERSLLFRKVFQWKRDSDPGCLKTYAVFFATLLFEALDRVGLGSWFLGEGGCGGRLHRCRLYEINKGARERIVQALGGEEECRKIRTVLFNPTKLKECIDLNDDYFQPGEWIVQAEDPAGRRIVAFRVKDNQNCRRTEILTIHQHFRETARRGDEWNFNSLVENVCYVRSIDDQATMIWNICNQNSSRYTKNPKP